VLLKEMQSLALDVKPMREDGRGIETTEEDDELLRAAEELGVDLSADRIRSTARQPDAQELEEGTERVDADGELTLAADEELGVREGLGAGSFDEDDDGFSDDDEGGENDEGDEDVAPVAALDEDDDLGLPNLDETDEVPVEE
jgi:DNA-directed RNA polymerase subunit beta